MGLGTRLYGIDIDFVTVLRQFLSRDTGKDPLLPNAQVLLAFADQLIGNRPGDRCVVGIFAPVPDIGAFMKPEHLRSLVLVEKVAYPFERVFRLADQILVTDIEPLRAVQLSAPVTRRDLKLFPQFRCRIHVGRPKPGLHIGRAIVAAVAGDKDDLGVGEILQDRCDVENVLRTLFGPSRLALFR